MALYYLESNETNTLHDSILSQLVSFLDSCLSEDPSNGDLNRLSANLKSGLLELSNHETYYISRAPRNLWLEYLLFREKFNRLANDRIETDFPLYLLIEPTSICNLRCVMCFQIDKSFSGDKSFMGRMDLDLFKKIIDEAHHGGTRAVTLASRGDPTLNKDLPAMLRYMKGKFLEVKLNTNGVLLNDEISRSILENQVTDLVFSIDSYEKQNYEAIRRKAKFDKVVNNISNFITLREKEYPHHRTSVRVSGVKVDEQQDRMKFNEFWLELVDHCVLVDIQERWDTYFNEELPVDQLLPCGDLFERMYVWWDGSVNPCDVDYKSTLSTGNLKNASIREIWNGPKYSALRNAHLNGKRNVFKVCAQCDNWTCKKEK